MSERENARKNESSRIKENRKMREQENYEAKIIRKKVQQHRDSKQGQKTKF